MDALEWLIVAAIVALVGALGMSLYETSGKECVKYDQQTAYILVGKVPVPYHQCTEWKEAAK